MIPYFRKNTFDEAIIDWVWNKNVYQLMQPVKQNDVVADVGAHIGTFTCKIASKASKIYSFEPEPENYKLLLKNTENLNNVQPRQLLLWNNNEDYLNFTISKTNSGAHTVINGKCKDPKIQWSVRATILDDNIFDKLDFLKIDVEGAEHEVLQGASQTLLSDKPFITVEIHSPTIKQKISKFLKQHSYKLYEPKIQYGPYYAKPVNQK